MSGVAGLGRSKISLPSQVSSYFRFPRKFTLCLPPLTESGVVFFGDVTYNFNPPGGAASANLSYTLLVANPFRPSDYFIGVQGIKVGGEDVPSVNKSKLSINSKGNGGTMISLSHPYTIMETSIYKAITTIFNEQLTTVVKRVNPVAPFQFCYDSNTIGFSPIGPMVQDIDLVLQSKEVKWIIAPLNSMVRMNDKAYCLGILDGGNNPSTSIIIGGFQIEDNLLQFDLDKSMIGFSSSLIYNRMRCSNFNFTSNVI